METREESKYPYFNNKKKIYLLTQKVYKYLREYGCVNLRKLKSEIIRGQKYHTMGYYHGSDCSIDLDYRFSILPTLIHECLHHYYPQWDEKKVLKEERMIMALLSKKQAVNIIKALAMVL